jgi:hypothetical protein
MLVYIPAVAVVLGCENKVFQCVPLKIKRSASLYSNYTKPYHDTIFTAV